MILVNHNIKKLQEIIFILEQHSNELYTSPQEIFNGASIGQHFRHIIEFYICLEKGAKGQVICYDERERDLRLENNPEFAVNSIKNIIGNLAKINADLALKLKANYQSTISEGENNSLFIHSSLLRELAYALDHTVHHLAIINIALKEEESINLPVNFGVAASTVRFKNKKEVHA
jgi:hypothetical protein